MQAYLGGTECVEQMDQLSLNRFPHCLYVYGFSLCMTVELAFISSLANDRLWREDEDEKENNKEREKMNRQQK